MLTMKRLPEEEKTALLKVLGIEREAFIYASFERGQRTGYAVFEYNDGKVTVSAVSYDGDENLFDGLIRSGMAYMMDSGLERLYFADKLDRVLLHKLGFIDEKSNYVNSVGDFLKTCKKCRM